MTRISQKNSGENHATSTIDMNGIFYSAPEMALSALPVGFLKKRLAFKKQGTGGGGGLQNVIYLPQEPPGAVTLTN